MCFSSLAQPRNLVPPPALIPLNPLQATPHLHIVAAVAGMMYLDTTSRVQHLVSSFLEYSHKTAIDTPSCSTLLPFFSALAAAAAAALPPCALASWLAVIGAAWLCDEGAAVAGRILLFPAVGESEGLLPLRCAQTVAGSDLDVIDPGGMAELAAKSVLDPGRGAVEGRRFGREDIARGAFP